MRSESLLGLDEKFNSISVGEMRDDPLNPNTIVLLFELKLLKSLCVKMTDFLILQDLLSFLDVARALVHDISCLVNLAQQLLRYSPDPSTTVDHSVPLMLRMGFKMVHDKFEGELCVERTQISVSTQHSIVSGFSFLRIDGSFTSQY